MILRCTLYTVLKTRFTKCLRHAQVDFFYVDHDKFMHHALNVLDSSVYSSLISIPNTSLILQSPLIFHSCVPKSFVVLSPPLSLSI